MGADYLPLQRDTTKGLFFVLANVFIDILGIGIIIPIIPDLIKHLINGSTSEASQYAIWLTLSYSVTQFLFSPILGGISDKYGRRPVLLLSLLGFGLDYLFLAFSNSITLLFIGRILAGFFGASFTTANAYISDITPPENRAQRFGLIGAAFGIGFILGPPLGGFLGTYGLRIPFYFASALSLINVIFGYFFLPESLSRENRRKFDIKRSNPLGSLLALKKYPSTLALVGVLFIVYISGYATQGTWTFATKEKFNWDEKMVGLSLGFVGVMAAIVQGGLLRVIIPKIGPQRAIFVGLLFNAFSLMGFAFANEAWIMYLIIVPYAFSGLSGPSFQSIITGKVDSSSQGEIQGALTSVMSLASILGQPLMLGLFRYFTKENTPLYFPGAPFLMGSILSLSALLLTYTILKKKN
ncbi:MAG: TCR/Tet family MFS transporter [Leadbetterella sp.]